MLLQGGVEDTSGEQSTQVGASMERIWHVPWWAGLQLTAFHIRVARLWPT